MAQKRQAKTKRQRIEEVNANDAERENEINEAWNALLEYHDAWAADSSSDDVPPGDYYDLLDDLLLSFGGRIPRSWRAPLVFVENLAMEYVTVMLTARTGDAHIASVLRVTECVARLRAALARLEKLRSEPVRPLESVAELNEQKVSVEQISRMLGLPYAEVVREIRKPGSVCGPDWVSPMQAKLQAERDAEAFETVNRRNEALEHDQQDHRGPGGRLEQYGDARGHGGYVVNLIAPSGVAGGPAVLGCAVGRRLIFNFHFSRNKKMALDFWVEREAWKAETARYAGIKTQELRAAGKNVEYAETLAAVRNSFPDLKRLRYSRFHEEEINETVATFTRQDKLRESRKGAPTRYGKMSPAIPEIYGPKDTDQPIDYADGYGPRWQPGMPSRAGVFTKTEEDWVARTAREAREETLKRRANGENAEYMEVLKEIRSKAGKSGVKTLDDLSKQPLNYGPSR